MVAYFMDDDMANQTFQRLAGLAPIVQKHATIDKHPVDLQRGVEVTFMPQFAPMIEADNIEGRLEPHRLHRRRNRMH
jgi:hypothetical protein